MVFSVTEQDGLFFLALAIFPPEFCSTVVLKLGSPGPAVAAAASPGNLLEINFLDPTFCIRIPPGARPSVFDMPSKGF